VLSRVLYFLALWCALPAAAYACDIVLPTEELAQPRTEVLQKLHLACI